MRDRDTEREKERKAYWGKRKKVREAQRDNLYREKDRKKDRERKKKREYFNSILSAIYLIGYLSNKLSISKGI